MYAGRGLSWCGKVVEEVSTRLLAVPADEYAVRAWD
jgi:hypothetical protein